MDPCTACTARGLLLAVYRHTAGSHVKPSGQPPWLLAPAGSKLAALHGENGDKC